MRRALARVCRSLGRLRSRAWARTWRGRRAVRALRTLRGRACAYAWRAWRPATAARGGRRVRAPAERALHVAPAGGPRDPVGAGAAAGTSRGARRRGGGGGSRGAPSRTGRVRERRRAFRTVGRRRVAARGSAALALAGAARCRGWPGGAWAAWPTRAAARRVGVAARVRHLRRRPRRRAALPARARLVRTRRGGAARRRPAAVAPSLHAALTRMIGVPLAAAQRPRTASPLRRRRGAALRAGRRRRRARLRRRDAAPRRPASRSRAGCGAASPVARARRRARAAAHRAARARGTPRRRRRPRLPRAPQRASRGVGAPPRHRRAARRGGTRPRPRPRRRARVIARVAHVRPRRARLLARRRRRLPALRRRSHLLHWHHVAAEAGGARRAPARSAACARPTRTGRAWARRRSPRAERRRGSRRPPRLAAAPRRRAPPHVGRAGGARRRAVSASAARSARGASARSGARGARAATRRRRPRAPRPRSPTSIRLRTAAPRARSAGGARPREERGARRRCRAARRPTGGCAPGRSTRGAVRARGADLRRRRRAPSPTATRASCARRRECPRVAFRAEAERRGLVRDAAPAARLRPRAAHVARATPTSSARLLDAAGTSAVRLPPDAHARFARCAPRHACWLADRSRAGSTWPRRRPRAWRDDGAAQPRCSRAPRDRFLRHRQRRARVADVGRPPTARDRLARMARALGHWGTRASSPRGGGGAARARTPRRVPRGARRRARCRALGAPRRPRAARAAALDAARQWRDVRSRAGLVAWARVAGDARAPSGRCSTAAGAHGAGARSRGDRRARARGDPRAARAAARRPR